MQMTSRTEQGIVIVSLEGRLDSATSAQVKGTLNELIQGGATKLVVDMALVPFIDSSGLAALISAYKRLRQGDGDLVLASVTQPVRLILEVTRLHRVFDVYPTMDAALDALA